jgi:hypothetical protein
MAVYLSAPLGAFAAATPRAAVAIPLPSAFPAIPVEKMSSSKVRFKVLL